MMDGIATDAELVERSKNGDRAAFAALVSRHYEFVFKVAFKWTGNREDAQDVAQDVSIRLGSSIQSWSGDTQLTTWLYKVVLNAVRDRHRREAALSRKHIAFAADPLRADCVNSLDCGGESELDTLWTAVRELPEKLRDAVLLVYGQELSHVDASRVMGCAEGTVSSHIHQAKKKLKAKLSQPEKEGVM